MALFSIKVRVSFLYSMRHVLSIHTSFFEKFILLESLFSSLSSDVYFSSRFCSRYILFNILYFCTLVDILLVSCLEIIFGYMGWLVLGCTFCCINFMPLLIYVDIFCSIFLQMHWDKVSLYYVSRSCTSLCLVVLTLHYKVPWGVSCWLFFLYSFIKWMFLPWI